MDEKYIPVCKGGGIFHSKKVEYTKETQQLVKKLINESKLTTLQRIVLNNMVKNGDPLPKQTTKNEKIVSILQPKTKSFKKRSKDAIEQSGAYEREKFTPIHNSVPYENKKLRFQSLMAYGKDMQIVPDKTSRIRSSNINKMQPIEEPTKEEMFDSLVNEVEERAQFLEDMELLGEENKYKDIIENEIAAKMRQMEMLDKERYKNQTGTVELFREKYKALRAPKTLFTDVSE